MIGCKPLNKEEQFSISNSLLNSRDKMLFLLILKTGLRISELLSVKLSSLFDQGALKGSIRVEKRFTKGKVGTRDIPLSKDILEALDAYIKSLPKAQDWLFETDRGQMSRIQAWRVISQAATRAGVKGKVAPHSGRKTMAKTIYELSNKDLVLTQKALGHKQINSTISYLSFYTQQDVNDIILKGQE